MDSKLLKNFNNTLIQGWISKKKFILFVKLVCYLHYFESINSGIITNIK